jgi:hypothetical protein
MDSRDREAAFGKWYDRFDQESMTIFITMYNDEDEEEEVAFPARYEVCGLCDGRGRHVNPSIDSEGISAEEFYEDPDFAEEYHRGTYDVSCYRCGGNRVEPVVDEARCDPESLKRLNNYLKSRSDDIREREAERRFGC